MIDETVFTRFFPIQQQFSAAASCMQYKVNIQLHWKLQPPALESNERKTKSKTRKMIAVNFYIKNDLQEK